MVGFCNFTLSNCRQICSKLLWKHLDKSMKKQLLKKVENIVAKEEIACFEQFLLLSQCFQKSSCAKASKSIYMWERDMQTLSDASLYSRQLLKMLWQRGNCSESNIVTFCNIFFLTHLIIILSFMVIWHILTWCFKVICCRFFVSWKGFNFLISIGNDN